MTIDDETPVGRLPIPLIYRPLRRLMYGVLFGAKFSVVEDDEKEEEEDGKEDEVRESKVFEWNFPLC